MQFFKKETNFNFLGRRKAAVILSAVAMLISIGSIALQGLNLGIDFTGGTLIEVGYEKPADLSTIRAALSNSGFPEAIVQHFGTSKDVLVRLAPRDEMSNAEISTQILTLLQSASESTVQMRRVEFVGPQIGEELTEDGGLALIFALFGILIYVGLRFEYRFALGSVAALIHDVVLTIGFFSLFQIEFDLTVLAAVLAVIGYSLNDTIVVFDRIRENFRKVRNETTEEIMNISLNQTLSRTLTTSMTTLLVLIALFFLGGELIHSFAIALILGVLIGTYSSIYVATTAALALGVSKEDLLPVEKEGVDDIDEMP